jgi:hypothetical protein
MVPRDLLGDLELLTRLAVLVLHNPPGLQVGELFHLRFTHLAHDLLRFYQLDDPTLLIALELNPSLLYLPLGLQLRTNSIELLTHHSNSILFDAAFQFYR